MHYLMAWANQGRISPLRTSLNLILMSWPSLLLAPDLMSWVPCHYWRTFLYSSKLFFWYSWWVARSRQDAKDSNVMYTWLLCHLLVWHECRYVTIELLFYFKHWLLQHTHKLVLPLMVTFLNPQLLIHTELLCACSHSETMMTSLTKLVPTYMSVWVKFKSIPS